MLITPWITSLWLLVVVTAVTGIMFGYFDAGEKSLTKYWTTFFL